MKKLVLRIVSIVAAFLLGVLGMGYYLMAGNTDSTAHMASATLPLIYLEQGGRSFNLMHGYTKSMDASSIRDAVLPLPEDREISLRIESPDTAVQDIHYEVRSLDMDRLIEDGELEYTQDGDTIRADFQLMDLLEDEANICWHCVFPWSRIGKPITIRISRMWVRRILPSAWSWRTRYTAPCSTRTIRSASPSIWRQILRQTTIRLDLYLFIPAITR